jgi:outer membrane biosynthesis protein TonB
VSHPDADTLRDFIAGALDADADASVREHLRAGCEQCQALVQGEAALDHALWEVARADAGAIADAGDPIAPVVPLAPRRQLPRWSAWAGAAAVAASALVAVFVTTAGDEQPAAIADADQLPAPGQVPAGQLAMAGAPGAAGQAAAVPAQPAAQPVAVPPAVPTADPAPAATPPTAKPEPKPAVAKPASRKPRGTAKPAAKPKPPPEPEPAPKPKPKRRRDCDPILDLDCGDAPSRTSGGAGGKASLSPTDVLTVVRKNLGAINKCGSKHGVKGTLKAEWRILKSGRTSSVKVMTPAYADTPVGKCVVASIKKWKFPPYTGSPPPPVKFPFKLKG